MIDNLILNQDMEYIIDTVENVRKFNGKRILITGCAGFLGFNFVNFFCYLIENGLQIEEIILLDNFIFGKPSWLEYIENKYQELKIYNFNIAYDSLSDVKNATNLNYIIHMASIASPSYYRKYPIETLDANVWGLRKLLDFYRNLAVDNLLFFSSSEIYGDPPQERIPTEENYNGDVSCLGPRASYDEAKRFGETLCYFFNQIYNIPICIVRPFNNYGPGMRIGDKRVPADFAKSVVLGEDIRIFSDGSPRRTFCYISDAMIGYLKALLYDRFDFFNIGIDYPEISITELAEVYKNTARELFGYKGKIVYCTSQDMDYLHHNPRRRCPNIGKAKNILNYDPKIAVNEGVKRYLEFLSLEGKK
jgi:UDP-glucuronate decarboxylase